MKERTEEIRVGGAVVRVTERGDGRWALYWRENGRSCSSTRKTRKEARGAAKAQARRLDRRDGRQLVSPADAAVLLELKRAAGDRNVFAVVGELQEALRILDGRRSLVEAARAVAGGRAVRCGVTAATREFLAGYLPKVASADRSKYTERTLRYELEGFAERWGALEVIELTPEILADWAGRNDVSARTYNNRLATLRTWLAWCVRTGYLESEGNPGKVVETRKELRKAPSVWTPEIAERILALLDGKTRAYFAVACWGGLRPHEITGLRWDDVDLAGGHVHVRAEVAGKVGADRFVPIAENLGTLLGSIEQREGKLALAKSREKISRVARDEGIIARWVPDTPRHSYISYRLAVTKNIEQVAEEAGNSPAVIRKAYRRPMREEDGKAWFQVGLSSPLK